MALEQSTIVRITATIAAGGVPRLPFGRGLLITQDEAIAAGGSGKAVLVSSFNEANDLLSAGDALDAARTWFSADPIPQGVWLGRWAEAGRVHLPCRGRRYWHSHEFGYCWGEFQSGRFGCDGGSFGE